MAYGGITCGRERDEPAEVLRLIGGKTRLPALIEEFAAKHAPVAPEPPRDDQLDLFG